MPYVNNVAPDQNPRSLPREQRRPLNLVAKLPGSVGSVAPRSACANAQADLEPHRPQKACDKSCPRHRQGSNIDSLTAISQYEYMLVKVALCFKERILQS